MGNAVSYHWDSLNRMTGVQTQAGLYEYTYIGTNPMVRYINRPDGSTTNYQYDDLNRLTQITNRKVSAELINQHVYTYNQQDLISGETIDRGIQIATPPAVQATAYTHNEVNQLIGTSDPQQNYSFDEHGNMTSGYTPEG